MITRLWPLAPSEPVRCVLAALLVLGSVAEVALAQGAPSPVLPQVLHAVSAPTQRPAQLRGTALDGSAVDIQALRGKVVLVVYWSTDCAVCRDLMPELRRNVAGWKDQPFALVGVSFDARREDALTYAQLMATLVPASMRFPTLWKGDPGFLNTLGTPDLLPGAWLLDKQGHVVERFQGRIPAEAWNRIADLL